MFKRGKEGGGILRGIKNIIYGLAFHESATDFLRSRVYMENLFMLMTLGDMIGFPVIPPYYSLKLFPYAVPSIEPWKNRLLRERDFTLHAPP
jgi:hypothetical protein